MANVTRAIDGEGHRYCPIDHRVLEEHLRTAATGLVCVYMLSMVYVYIFYQLIDPTHAISSHQFIITSAFDSWSYRLIKFISDK